MVGIIAGILADLIVNLFADFLYDEFGFSVGTGHWIIIFVFIAYVLMRIWIHFLVQHQISRLRDSPEGTYFSPDFGWKYQALLMKVKNGLPISGFAIGMLLCKQYYPWTEGLLSVTTWIASSLPFILASWGFQKSDFEYFRYKAKIDDRIHRYRCVTEKWLQEAFPHDRPQQIRQQMQLYVQRTLGQAERLDTSDPTNWVIRWGGHGREAGRIYHQLLS